MTAMWMKLSHLGPEMVLLTAAVMCLFTGLSPAASVRRGTSWLAALALLLAGSLAIRQATPSGGGMSHAEPLALAAYVKASVAFVGLLLLSLLAAVPDSIRQNREAEQRADYGGTLDTSSVMRGEFFAFFLFSLTGVMLCAGATDLVWLFLALELTSLPTYVLVSIMRDRITAQEAGVKYFFLGALGAAVFLYGFTLIYGTTGTTLITSADPLTPSIAGFVKTELAHGRSLHPLLLTGFALAVTGIAFKIAAFPMHAYAADVYQGAASPVTAMLAFVPKTAGFVALIILLQAAAGDQSILPLPLHQLIWIMAAVTMTLGNTMGLLQTNLKRLMAYSSIAHSGYMLVALLGVGATAQGMNPDQPLGQGAAAILFYLVAYALGTIGIFSVLGSLRQAGEEIETFDDISGLSRRHPVLAAILLVSSLSLIGLPPMVGFVGKLHLFGAALSHSQDRGDIVWLVVLGVINSAIAAVYYLRMIAAAYFGEPKAPAPEPDWATRRLTAVTAAVLVIVLGISGNWLVLAAGRAASDHRPRMPIQNTGKLVSGQR